MVDRNLIAAKLAELADRVSRVRGRCPESADELRGDRDALDVLSFNLMLAVQSCADIASHVIADEGWPTGTNLAGGFKAVRDQVASWLGVDDADPRVTWVYAQDRAKHYEVIITMEKA